MRNSMLALACALTITGLSLTPQPAAAQDADAIACMPPSWYLAIPTEPLTDVPIEGVLTFQGMLQTMDGTPTATEALEYITVVVTDSESVEVPGTLSYEHGLGAVVWTSAEPLAAEATYQVAITVDNTGLSENGYCGGGWEPDLTGEFAVTTSAGPVAPVTAASLGTATLGEWVQPVSACCTINEDATQCYSDPRGYNPCEQCWVNHYESLPQLDVSWTSELGAESMPYAYFTIEKKTDSSSYETENTLNSSTTSATVRFDVLADTYCVRVVAHQVSDGSEAASEEICVPHSELSAGQVPEVAEPDLSQCTGPVTGDGLTGTYGSDREDDGCGCQVSSPAPSRAAPALFLVALLAVAVLRLR